MTNKSPLFTPFLSLLLLLSATCYAKDDNLIKTKCYKTEDPVGEVCLFEDRKAVSTNKEKYQETCEEPAKLSIKTITQPELRVTDSNGTESDRTKIQYLSELNLVKMRVADKKTFYTSYKNSACSVWRGSIHTPFWVADGKIIYLNIDNKNKFFMNTLRKTWSPVYDGFLEVASELSKTEGIPWETSFIRYQNISGKWISAKRTIPEMTEIENDESLNEKNFPPRVKQ